MIEVIRINSLTTVITDEYIAGKIFDGIEQPDSVYVNLDFYEFFETLTIFNPKYRNHSIHIIHLYKKDF